MNFSDYTSRNHDLKNTGTRQNWSMRIHCGTSHYSYDDPIVSPNKKGAAHLHMFFGNTLADHSSTYDSLIRSGEGTCAWWPLNRTSYWIPALFDRQNNVRVPQYSEIYYKSAELDGKKIHELPEWLKMIAWKASAKSIGENDGVYDWYCGWPQNGKRYNVWKLIPDCRPWEFLSLKLVYPQCWDGKNLDSSDHRKHLAYPVNKKCPSSHPVAIPEVTYNMYWNNNDVNTYGWYLSSDKHEHMNTILPGWTTTHGDWFWAWHPEVLTKFTNECNNRNHDCIGGTVGYNMKLELSAAKSYINDPDFFNKNINPQKIPFNKIENYFH